MSYSELMNVWLKERHEEDLQALPPLFYKDMGSYILRLREETRMLEKETTKSKIVVREKENVEKMLDDLFTIRLKKIVSMGVAEKEVSTEKLALEERRFLLEFKKAVSEHLENLKSILKGRVEEIKAKPKSGFKVIRVLVEIPAIVGIDMATYGPFKPEDVAAIPSENAENLIKRGLAVEVEED